MAVGSLYIAGQLAGAFLGVMVATSCSAKRLYIYRSMSVPGGAQLFSKFHCHFGPAVRNLRLRSAAVESGAGRGRPVYNRLLVYRIYIVYESCRDDGASRHQYLCRNSPAQCTGLYRGAVGWRSPCLRLSKRLFSSQRGDARLKGTQ